MGLFKKKEETKNEVPRLPELPRLQELPEFPSEESNEELPQLPSFPKNTLGNKFSQDTIKEAITGRKEEEVEADEFVDEDEEEHVQMMRKPLTKEGTKKDSYSPFEKAKTKEAEPIFIRIDKFEEGSQTFEEVKKQIVNIERMFEDVKKVKEKEDRELGFWEAEIKQIKDKIEKIDNNIFSKI
ncbi:hypothetical protein M0R19_00530 [Candidatus Pacearchaeota archaeon]|jgi:hypothetical protein|nr:hypothetical protein [Candidatus Pacearchaeota archaeon]